jgi:CxxC motif-containing protein (DUF1111 family)
LLTRIRLGEKFKNKVQKYYTMRKLYIIGSLVMITMTIAIVSSCSKIIPDMINPEDALCGPVSLDNSQTILFSQGNDQFFAIRSSSSGLGPYFVSNSCGGCHSSDNRGHPFTILTRFGQTDSTGNKFLAQGGPQLGTFNLPGFQPEQVPAGATSTQLIAPITAGVGFLEAVPDTEIINNAIRNENNPDGVRGHPNYNTVPSYVIQLNGSVQRNDGKYICRFGRKASTYSLLQQTAQAYSHDMGITSSYLPVNPYNYLDQEPPPPSSTPEVSNDDFNSVVFYVTCLQTPVQRNPTDPVVQHGNALFIQVGCETCHKQTMTTGYSPIAALSYQTFNPFSDLLVHDMGPGLDDHYTEGDAKTSEWRTAPLWGLGLAPQVQGGNVYLLHDGRAHSIQQAIQMHGGEAAVSSARFGKLSAQDQNSILTFLKSL